MYKIKIFVDYADEKNVEAAVTESPLPRSVMLLWIAKLLDEEPQLTAFRVEAKKVS